MTVQNATRKMILLFRVPVLRVPWGDFIFHHQNKYKLFTICKYMDLYIKPQNKHYDFYSRIHSSKIMSLSEITNKNSSKQRKRFKFYPSKKSWETNFSENPQSVWPNTHCTVCLTNSETLTSPFPVTRWR